MTRMEDDEDRIYFIDQETADRLFSLLQRILSQLEAHGTLSSGEEQASDTRMESDAGREVARHLKNHLLESWLQKLKQARLHVPTLLSQAASPEDEWNQFLPIQHVTKIQLVLKEPFEKNRQPSIAFNELLTEKNLPAIVVGMPGLGKTTSALLMAREQLERFFQGLYSANDHEETVLTFPVYLELGNHLHQQFFLSFYERPDTQLLIGEILKDYFLIATLLETSDESDQLERSSPVMREFLAQLQNFLERFFTSRSLQPRKRILWILDGWNECKLEVRRRIVSLLQSRARADTWIILTRPGSEPQFRREYSYMIKHFKLLPLRKDDAVNLLLEVVRRSPLGSGRDEEHLERVMTELVGYLKWKMGEEALTPFYLLLTVSMLLTTDGDPFSIASFKKRYPHVRALFEDFLIKLILRYINRYWGDADANQPESLLRRARYIERYLGDEDDGDNGENNDEDEKIHRLARDILTVFTVTVWVLYLSMDLDSERSDRHRDEQIRLEDESNKGTWFRVETLKKSLRKSITIILPELMNYDSFRNLILDLQFFSANEELLFHILKEVLFPKFGIRHVRNAAINELLGWFSSPSERMRRERYRGVIHELFLDHLLANAITLHWFLVSNHLAEMDTSTREASSGFPTHHEIAKKYLEWMANEQFDATWRLVITFPPFGNNPLNLYTFYCWMMKASSLPQEIIAKQLGAIQEITIFLESVNVGMIYDGQPWEHEHAFRMRLSPRGILRLQLRRTFQLLENHQDRTQQLEQLLHVLCELQSLKVLDLSVNALTELPRSLGKLTSLEVLHLTRNRLLELPPEIGNLSNLRLLYVTSNQLKSLPTTMARLTNLRELGLRNNRIRELTVDFSRLVHLSRLYLNANHLETFPESLTELKSLISLDLSHNQLTSLPPSIQELESLQKLDCRHNKIDALPEEIGCLTNLRKLDLRNNHLRVLPPSLGNLTNLQALYLSGNALTELPENFGNLTNLRKLYLQANALKYLPRSLGNLKNLQKLYLQENQLRNLPETIGNLVSLQKMDLEGNQLRTLPETIGNLQHLQKLYVNHNKLRSLPASIGKLSKLRRFLLRKNQLRTLPREITDIQSLERLDLSKNQLEGLPETIGTLKNLRKLYLQENQLRALPESLGDLKNLRVLDLSDNFLEQLPETIGQLSKLQKLYLQESGLKTLPRTIGNLTSLKELKISGLDFQELPQSLGDISSLRKLAVRGTSLRALPDSIGKLTQLIELDLRYNKIAALPANLHGLRRLKTLLLRGNQLQVLPESLGSLPKLRKLDLSHNYLQRLPLSLLKLPKLKWLDLRGNDSLVLGPAHQVELENLRKKNCTVRL